MEHTRSLHWHPGSSPQKEVRQRYLIKQMGLPLISCPPEMPHLWP